MALREVELTLEPATSAISTDIARGRTRAEYVLGKQPGNNRSSLLAGTTPNALSARLE